MVTLTRKERERKQREIQILDLSRSMLLESGYLGLSMDRIAEAMEYSKGTIYQHFCNKEEIILALANQGLETRLNLFRKGATWPGPSRDRMTAIGVAAEVFVERYPHYFTVEQIVRSASIWEKTSPERRDFMRTCEASCMHVVGGVVRDAIAQGDLELGPDESAETLVFGLWSLHFGAHTLLTSSETLPEIGISDGQHAVRLNMTLLLDGFGWKPLSTDRDYYELNARITEEFFSDE